MIQWSAALRAEWDRYMRLNEKAKRAYYAELAEQRFRNPCRTCGYITRSPLQVCRLCANRKSRMTHGYNRYTVGCRCDVCRAAKAEYMREKRASARQKIERDAA